MRSFGPIVAAALIAAFVATVPASAQMTPQPTGTPEHRTAIDRLDNLDGEWAGPAWTMGPGGVRIEMVQTERVGDLLGGSIKLVEGRGWEGDRTGFNAFAVISFDPRAGAYTFTTFVGGEKHDFPMQVSDDGFVWERPAGPNAVVRFTAVVRDGIWHEVGEYIAAGQPPRKIVELNLRRVGDSRWPLGEPIDPARGR